MFNHDHHQKIIHVLRSLKSSVFEEVGAYFGGGTLITLLYGEYRWSKDIDFICPVGEGYRKLRGLIHDNSQASIFFEKTDGIEFSRDIKADQYGIRFPIKVDGISIKFEIIAEARITLNPPERFEHIPVPCLDFNDCCTEKLLANADRWNDTSIESRDLIDLAILRLQHPISQEAMNKAEGAYPVIDSLSKAIDKFQSTPQYREKCFSALQIDNRPAIIDGLDLLAIDRSKPLTVRTSNEIK